MLRWSLVFRRTVEEREQVAFQKVGHGYRVPVVSVRSVEAVGAWAHVMQRMIAGLYPLFQIT